MPTIGPPRHPDGPSHTPRPGADPDRPDHGRESPGHASTRRWHRVYRARMRAGLEPCRYGCGAPATSFDRLVPHLAGGHYTFDNTTLACVPCNSARGHAPAPPELRSLQAEEALRPPRQRWSLLPVQAGGAPPVHRLRSPERRSRQRRRHKNRIRAHLAVEHERSGAT